MVTYNPSVEANVETTSANEEMCHNYYCNGIQYKMQKKLLEALDFFIKAFETNTFSKEATEIKKCCLTFIIEISIRLERDENLTKWLAVTKEQFSQD
jgi:hypothetical protein